MNRGHCLRGTALGDEERVAMATEAIMIPILLRVQIHIYKHNTHDLCTTCTQSIYSAAYFAPLADVWGDGDLPPGWREISDSSEVYFWHVPTGTTQYHRPVASSKTENKPQQETHNSLQPPNEVRWLSCIGTVLLKQEFHLLRDHAQNTRVSQIFTFEMNRHWSNLLMFTPWPP